jgi:hypothetical protein
MAIEKCILVYNKQVHNIISDTINFTVDGEHGRGIVAWNTGTRNTHKD